VTTRLYALCGARHLVHTEGVTGSIPVASTIAGRRNKP